MILGIYGASGMGRETLELAKIINSKNKCWDSFVFIDDAQAKQGTLVSGVEVISFNSFKNLAAKNDVKAVIALGEPAFRADKYAQLKSAGISLQTMIHPDVYIPGSATIGEGVIINAYDFISVDIKIGDNTLIQSRASIGHDTVIGSHSVISTGVFTGGASYVGDKTYIGVNACLQQLVKVGSESIIGMGSVVNRDIPDNMIAIGFPALTLKTNDDKRVFK